ncbi:MAG: hypothetical protein R2771_13660 [Saprospiraceae bacterium]
MEGGSKHSFGIHVARMSGMPVMIIDRAYDILNQLEKKWHDDSEKGESIDKKLKEIEKERTYQLSIFDMSNDISNKLKSELETLDLNSMTPIDCMIKINELKKIIEENED